MVTVLKLGGSVITDKDARETVDRAALDRAVAAIADALERGEASGAKALDSLVVVHGGGSFGHPAAANHDVSATAGTRDSDAVLAIHRAMVALNDAVVDTLQERGVPALPVHPLSVAHRSGGDLSVPMAHLETMLGEGFVPVAHGDVIAHEGSGATVLSGDELVVALARGLEAERVGLCSATPGVLDEDGRVIPAVDAYDEVAAALGESEATDVTGGMAGKVQSLLALDTPASVFALDGLADFLAGDRPGTTVR